MLAGSGGRGGIGRNAAEQGRWVGCLQGCWGDGLLSRHSEQAGRQAALSGSTRRPAYLVGTGQVEQREAQRGKLHRQRVVGAQLRAGRLGRRAGISKQPDEHSQ